MSLSVKDLDLTTEDFTMLMDALEHLPFKNTGNDVVDAMMDGVLAAHSPEKKDEISRKRKVKLAQDQRERADVIEKIRLLQAKIIMIKRVMIQENALKEANEIINK